MAPSTASLPIIDISPFLSDPSSSSSSSASNAAARRATTDALAAACRDFGFFYLTGHGVPEASTQGVLDAARAFFRQSAPAEKAAIRRQDPGRGVGDGARGYQVLAENVTQGKRDWHEALDLYRPIVAGEGLEADDLQEVEETEETEKDEGRAGASDDNNNNNNDRGDGGDPDAGKRLTLDLRPGQTGTRRRTPFALLEGVNMWPSRPAGFRARFEAYAEAMQRVGAAVLRALGEALALRDADAFVAATRRSFWVMRVIGYPPLDRELAAAGGVSCGAHTDYGCLTLLLADATRGALQVLHRRPPPAREDGSSSGGGGDGDGGEEEWITADPVPGAYVVNVGDMVEKWTNGLVRSTLHRVVHTGENYRVSIPFFLEPDRDAWVEPLEECVKMTGGVRKEGGVRYGDHLAAKVGGNFYGGTSGQDQTESVS